MSFIIANIIIFAILAICDTRFHQDIKIFSKFALMVAVPSVSVSSSSTHMPSLLHRTHPLLLKTKPFSFNCQLVQKIDFWSKGGTLGSDSRTARTQEVYEWTSEMLREYISRRLGVSVSMETKEAFGGDGTEGIRG